MNQTSHNRPGDLPEWNGRREEYMRRLQKLDPARVMEGIEVDPKQPFSEQVERAMQRKIEQLRYEVFSASVPSDDSSVSRSSEEGP